jgi:hypothetical protein
VNRRRLILALLLNPQLLVKYTYRLVEAYMWSFVTRKR